MSRPIAVELLCLALELPEPEAEVAIRGVTPQWDSLHHVELMFLIEERTGVLLEPDQLAAIRDVETLADAITRLSGTR